MNGVLKRGYGNTIINRFNSFLLISAGWNHADSFKDRVQKTIIKFCVLATLKKQQKKNFYNTHRKFRSSSFFTGTTYQMSGRHPKQRRRGLRKEISPLEIFFRSHFSNMDKHNKTWVKKKMNFSQLYIFAIHVAFGNATFPFHFATWTGVSSSYLFFKAAYPLTCSIQSYIISVSAPTSSQGPLTKHVEWQTIYKLWQANTQSLEIMRVTPGLCCTPSGGGRGIFGWWGHVTAEVEGTQGVERLSRARTKLSLLLHVFTV